MTRINYFIKEKFTNKKPILEIFIEKKIFNSNNNTLNFVDYFYTAQFHIGKIRFKSLKFIDLLKLAYLMLNAYRRTIS